MTMVQVRAYLTGDAGEEGRGQGVPMNHAQLCAYVAAYRAKKAKDTAETAVPGK